MARDRVDSDELRHDLTGYRSNVIPDTHSIEREEIDETTASIRKPLNIDIDDNVLLLIDALDKIPMMRKDEISQFEDLILYSLIAKIQSRRKEH